MQPSGNIFLTIFVIFLYFIFLIKFIFLLLLLNIGEQQLLSYISPWNSSVLFVHSSLFRDLHKAMNIVRWQPNTSPVSAD